MRYECTQAPDHRDMQDSDSDFEFDDDTGPPMPEFETLLEEAHGDNNHVRMAKVEKMEVVDEGGEREVGFLNIGAIKKMVEEKKMVKADENRGTDLLSVKECSAESLMGCIVWKEEAVQQFLWQVGASEQTLATHCRVVVRSARMGKMMEQKTRDMWLANQKKLTTECGSSYKCEFLIYDGANRIKVLLAFMYGKVTVNRKNSEGICTDKLYYSPEVALEHGHASLGDDGEIVLAAGYSALSEAGRELFESKAWNLFILLGTEEQCCMWARNENLERTAFESDQELPLVLGAEESDYCKELLKPLKDEWMKKNLGDTPVVNAGMILSYSLLKLHGMYRDKKAHEINTPARSKFKQLKESLKSMDDMNTGVENIQHVTKIFEMVSWVTIRILSKQRMSHMMKMSREQKRRLRLILCVVIDNQIDGVAVAASEDEFVRRSYAFFSSANRPKNTDVYKFLRMETARLVVARRPRSTPARAPRPRTPGTRGVMSPMGSGQVRIDSMLDELPPATRRRVGGASLHAGGVQ